MLAYNRILRAAVPRHQTAYLLNRCLTVQIRHQPSLISRVAFTVASRQFSQKPQIPEPPRRHTKEQLLAQSRHFIDRWKIRFKWALIRQNRPFNVDEISAFISWIVMGNVLWFVIGTTTFFGLVFYLFDKFVNNQSARNKYLMKLLKFDTANLDIKIDNNFSVSYEDGRLIFENLVINDLKIKMASLKLSFTKWHEGKGLIKDLELKGLRGTISLSENPNLTAFFKDDYELENFVVSDLLLYINGVKLQIFHAQLDKLRNKWFLYDLFNSDNCTGAINNSLFTIHIKQINRNYASFEELEKFNKAEGSALQTKPFTMSNYQNIFDTLFKKPLKLETSDSNQNGVTKDAYKQVIRFRIDELDVERLPKFDEFKWLKSGKLELIVDVMFPEEPRMNHERRISEELKSLLTVVYDKLMRNDSSPQRDLEPNSAASTRKYAMIDFKMQFKDLKCDRHNSSLDPGLVQFINNYHPENTYDVNSNDLDTLISSDDFSDDEDDEFSTPLPAMNFRIVENIQALDFAKLSHSVSSELMSNLNHLKLENDSKVKRYKDTSFVIKNLILVGLGVCFI